VNNNFVKSETPELSRHQRKCAVCRHPEREAIEEAFLHWHSPNQIASNYDLEEAAIYRHAHALNLFDRRSGNLRFALENFIERVDEIQEVKPDALVRAIHAYTRMKATGEWVEPPRQIIVTRINPPEDCLSSGRVEDTGHTRTEVLPGKPDMMQIILPELRLSRSSRAAGEGEAREAENRDSNTKKTEF
jgi:hypothetical protein